MEKSRWDFYVSRDGFYFREEGFIPPTEDEVRLSKEDYAKMTRKAPIPCVECVPVQKDGKVLLGYRTDEPAKDTFYTIGGGIIAGESFEEAAARVGSRELDLDIDPQRFRRAGSEISQVWANNPTGAKGGIHGITWVMYFDITEDEANDIVMDESHSRLKWVDPERYIHSSECHPVLRKYLMQIIEARQR